MKTLRYIILGGFLMLMSCDRQSNIIFIKNDTWDTLAVIPWNDKELSPITDSMVYDNLYSRSDIILPKKHEVIILPNRDFSKAPDSAKIDLYIFNLNVATNYEQKKLEKGILKRSLIYKKVIKASDIPKGIDTISISVSSGFSVSPVK